MWFFLNFRETRQTYSYSKAQIGAYEAPGKTCSAESKWNKINGENGDENNQTLWENQTNFRIIIRHGEVVKLFRQVLRQFPNSLHTCDCPNSITTPSPQFKPIVYCPWYSDRQIMGGATIGQHQSVTAVRRVVPVLAVRYKRDCRFP